MKAIVTGHSRGLGAGIARALLAGGAEVMGLARHAGDAQPGLRQVALDLADATALQAWLDGGELAAFLGGAQQALLINNAGVVQPVGAPGRLGGAQLAQAVAVNVSAVLVLTDAFVAATGTCPDRRVLHVSSGAARAPYAGWSTYCATKAALDMHARATVLDGVPGLAIASVAPGVIDTGMQAQIRAMSARDFPSIERFVALQRDGALDDPFAAGARLVAYALSGAFGREPVTDLRQLR
ncbi:NAD(P)-dependent dehydrogenase (short-subunit alcohol dehydrogenase family) [Pseudoduganella flava]|uniref:NAD(P)-dependent dehydrogenase (Short-subunit alcohol dehydrogenase family) n=1 Tax=Pseudoduganella flava TaxID=871742 RepID=A0A562PQ95_9BURK|nr:SDR family NAD(P)-dependent oxidoreductase [Pseudoduganella flava]QGZ37797.1 SDR family NAD(P)-dependent oxidoreductase [Pseudoduganella flava]TWI46612.1 NAD(P)-dependent dehydrogenase (short-subunit alcohol dehydrogenase family) [Pseudoduganella flava]